MKRRKFIQAALVAPVAATASASGASSERLYGTPLSVQADGGQAAARFMLPLSQTGLPADSWAELARVAQVVDGVLTSSEDSTRFRASPEKFLRSHGLDGSDKILNSEVTRMLACASDPAVRRALENSDWDGAIKLFKAAGLFEQPDTSVLTNRIATALQGNYDEIAKILRSEGLVTEKEQDQALLELITHSSGTPTEDDLAALYHLTSSGRVTPMFCTTVTICVAAVTAGAAVTAVVYLMVAVVSAAAVLTQVSTSGSSPQLPQLVDDRGGAFNGSMTRLDPLLVRNSQRTLRLGAILGNAELQTQVYRDLISREVDAFMRAMASAGLFRFDEAQLGTAISAVQAYSLRVCGLAPQSESRSK